MSSILKMDAENWPDHLSTKLHGVTSQKTANLNARITHRKPYVPFDELLRMEGQLKICAC
jgi:hypothetical protein